jgi:hypothetical protein
MFNLPVLWSSVRWNWGNTLAVAAFCVLSILDAASNLSIVNERDGAGARQSDCLHQVVAHR